MLEPLQNTVFQRALVELTLLAVPAGILGTWIVLRRLAFYAHAVGPATFPALTVAEAFNLNPQAAAMAAAMLFAALLELIARGGRLAYDSATGLLLVASIALGALLASDVFHSSGQVGNLLFGTLLATSDTDIALAALLTLLTLICLLLFGRSWTATAFDPASARSIVGHPGMSSGTADRVLLLLIAAGIVVAVTQVGALLVAALLVIPAATARTLARSLNGLMLGSSALAAVEGFVALGAAYQLNVPPGATFACAAGLIFIVAVATRAVVDRLRHRNAGARALANMR